MPHELRVWHSGRTCEHKDCVGVQKIIWPQIFSLWWKQRRIEELAEVSLDVKAHWSLTLCQTAQGWEVEKGLSCSSLAKVKRIKDDWVPRDNARCMKREMWKNRLAKVKSLYDLRKKRSEGAFWRPWSCKTFSGWDD